MIPSDRRVDYRIRESRRAKRISIRVLPPDGIVEVILPAGCSHAVAPGILQRHRSWILKQQRAVAKSGGQPPLPAQLAMPAIGESSVVDYRHQTDAPRTLIDTTSSPGKLIVFGNMERPGTVLRALQEHLKTIGKRHLPELLKAHAHKHGFTPGRITVRLQRTRWGSCSATGNISLNAKLLLLPAPLMHHVICHELAHLRFPNHSAAFWQTLEKIDPHTHRNHRWLREYARTLPPWVNYRP